MSMLKWAEKEVQLACKRKNPDHKDGEWDYGCACYESALKAFKSLLEDGHSGASIGITKNILVRLIDGKPLTPIEDTPDIWNECGVREDDNSTQYQCTRMHSLFKYVSPTGTISYNDVGRTSVTYINRPDIRWSDGLGNRIIDELFPVTMPYSPESKGYLILSEDFLVNPDNGDYDTVGYLEVITPSGEKKPINRFYKEDNHKFVEISYEEYCERKLAAHDI